MGGCGATHTPTHSQRGEAPQVVPTQCSVYCHPINIQLHCPLHTCIDKCIARPCRDITLRSLDQGLGGYHRSVVGAGIILSAQVPAALLMVARL